MDAVDGINTTVPPQTEDDIDAVPVCRICLMTNLVMRDLFHENDVSLSTKAMSFANVKMSPDDGLPSHICCVCADKLEIAYDFKLQVEQADSVLREKFDSLNIKGELFFNDVDVHLHNVNRSGNNSELMEDANYVHADESIEEMERNSQTGLLKDHLALLQVQKMNEQSDQLLHNEQQVVQQTLHKSYDKVDEIKQVGVPEEFMPMEPEEETPTETSLMLSPEQKEPDESQTAEYPTEKEFENQEFVEEPQDKSKSEQSDHGSDEENYFENLNLSSRLKQIKTDNSERLLFVCYICDKQFVSKDVLKEHMHSHEEIRQALTLKKTVEKTPKAISAPVKSPPSGKRANKCPHCGKEYLYIISFNKHLKQHERERSDKENESMDVEDDDSLRFSGFDNNEYSESEKEDENHSCDKCSESFATKRLLQKHKVKHIVLKCNVCEENFETLENLRDHRSKHIIEGILTEEDLKDEIESIEMIEKEQEEAEEAENGKSLKCPHCPMTFSRKKPFEKHVENHESKLTCKICSQKFGKQEALKKHMEQHAKKSFKCTQCSKVFGNELTLRNHLIATNHKTVISGQEYDPNKRIKRVAAKAAQKIIDRIKTENDSDEDEQDEEKSELEMENDNDELYAPPKDDQSRLGKKVGVKKSLDCTTCNKKCISKQALVKHMELHVKDEKNEKADKNDKVAEQREPVKVEVKNPVADHDNDDSDDFESGLDWPMDTHECPTCKKRYSTKKSLLRHQLLHEEPNFECDICNVKFYRKDKLKAHYDKCSERNPDQVRKCNICGDSFENNEMLKEHRAKHVSEGILSEEDLRDIEPRAEDKKPGEKVARKRRTDIVGLECTECNKQYTSRKGLLRHIQVHEGKKYLCDICPKKFYRREHLKIHVAKHNMVKPYKCTRCTKRFIKEEQLNNHLSKHDRSFKKNKETDSSKRFLCEICSKSFTQSTTLIAHLRAHNGIKPYVCEVCSRPFTTNAYLKMHMRTHTQERPYICQYCSRAFARADTLANHLTSHTGEAKYHCKYCPKNFRRLKSLKEHVFIHTGQRPYACPTCDRRFNNNGSRYAHSKRCKQNQLQNQNRNQATLAQVQIVQQQPTIQTQTQHVQPQIQIQAQLPQQLHQARLQQTLTQAQIIKSQNIKTITIARPADQISTQQVMQHQEILMPLILPLTVTLADVGEEVILPEGTKIFTTT